jgi:hypothetical protein
LSATQGSRKLSETVCLIGEASRFTPSVSPRPWKLRSFHLMVPEMGKSPPEKVSPKLMSAVLVSSSAKITFMSPYSDPGCVSGVTALKY